MLFCMATIFFKEPSLSSRASHTRAQKWPRWSTDRSRSTIESWRVKVSVVGEIQNDEPLTIFDLERLSGMICTVHAGDMFQW